MYRRISVHLDHGFDCKRRTALALELAKRHKAELVGVYASSAPPQYYYGESVMMSSRSTSSKTCRRRTGARYKTPFWKPPPLQTYRPSSAPANPRPAPPSLCTAVPATSSSSASRTATTSRPRTKTNSSSKPC